MTLAQHAAQHGAPLSGRDGGVVIADDDGDIQRLIVLAVRKAGLDVLAAVDNGQSALDAIREHRPTVAVLDVAMPKLTGLQVCAAVRADPTLSHIPILLLSAAVQPAAVAAGYSARADVYATKPFSPRSLAEQIADLALHGRQP